MSGEIDTLAPNEHSEENIKEPSDNGESGNFRSIHPGLYRYIRLFRESEDSICDYVETAPKLFRRIAIQSPKSPGVCRSDSSEVALAVQHLGLELYVRVGGLFEETF